MFRTVSVCVTVWESACESVVCVMQGCMQVGMGMGV